MGVFMIGSLVWMLAILLDKNRVFPKWFGYLSLLQRADRSRRRAGVDLPARRLRVERCDQLGGSTWWCSFSTPASSLSLLRRMIQREDFGTGPLPDLSGQG